MSIKGNLYSVQARIKAATVRSGRDESEVQLLGVTKYATDVKVQELVSAGLLRLGENRIQNLNRRMEQFPDAQWDFIGNLQTNKVRYCKEAGLIHSLDRPRLADALNTRAQNWDKIQEVLIQVNVSGEQSKSGIDPDDMGKFVKRILYECKNIKIRGLMTMAPFIDSEKTRPYFRELNRLYLELQQELGLVWDTLSMGMTNDFEVAIEEGSTLVRVGSALFTEED